MGLHTSGLTSGTELGLLLKARQSENGGRPLVFVASPFRRAVTMAHAAAEATESPVLVDLGVTEWYTPSLVGEDCYVPPEVDGADW